MTESPNLAPPSAGPSPASVGLILQLVRRDEFRCTPAAVRQELARGSLAGATAVEKSMIAAAASITGGEPKRALRELAAAGQEPGSDAFVVAEALRRLALTLDRNWFPGGSGATLEEGDLEAIVGQPLPDPGPGVALLVAVATDVVAMAPTWRTVIDGARRWSQLATMVTVLQHVETVGMQLASFGDPGSVGYLAMIHADLALRSGQFDAAANILGIALTNYQATNDVVGVGATSLVRGDWSTTPGSNPEILGLDLDDTMTSSSVEISPDPPFARELYGQAASSFAFGNAERGTAAIELRLAYLDRVDGAHDAARERLTGLRERAGTTGDGAFDQLARVHLALLDVEDDVQIEPETIGRDIATWAMADGSYSYARGLARLCLASARRWREAGDFGRGHAVLRISDGINAGVGAVQEPALVGAEAAESYGGANYRRALLVLRELDLDAAIAAIPERDPLLAWLGLVARTVGAGAAATALRDSDAIARANSRLRRLQSIGSSLTIDPASGEGMMAATAMVAVEGSIAQGDVLTSLYRGTTARSVGLPEEAEQRFSEALETARRIEPGGGLMTAVVLGTKGDRAEARLIVDQIAAAGGLPPDLGASLFLRVGAAAEAKGELAKLDAMGSPPGRAMPLDESATRAEVAVANEEWAAARTIADPAIVEFEARVARLSRDVLRISMGDNLDVVSLYTSAIRAHLATSDPAGVEAFRLSDRCRGMALADLLASDAATGSGPAAVAAMRRWLRAGVLLAQTFEEISSQPSDDGHAEGDAAAGPGSPAGAEALAPEASAGATSSAAVRSRIAAAERELDDAEAALYRAGGGALAGRSQAPPTPDLAEVQSLLAADTVLLQYHLFDDELFVWAVSADTAEMIRRPTRTALLSGDARRFHRLCADGMSTKEERNELGAALAGQLLDPVAGRLSGRARVVVVPHAGLSLLPFHLLPFEGDVLGAVRTVSFLPAVSVAPRWRDRPSVRLDGDALVVGDPTYEPGRNLRQLPSARLEAAVVASTLGATPLLGDAATLEAVLARLPGAHVIHLATHGRAIDGAPNSAELALAGDGRLTIADLMGSDTQIDLAVLSACDTGRGSATASGDVVGLTRALLGAGARDIVVSLWPVDDQTACLTMARFYERLSAGSSVAGSLADAQAEVRRRSPGERRHWYAELHAAHDPAAEPKAEGTRAWSRGPDDPPREADARHPALWGPFVHIGL